MPRRRRKTAGTSPQAAIAALSPAALYKLIPSVLLVVAFISVFAVLFALGFLWYVQREKKKRLRALVIADVDRMNGTEFETYIAELLRFQGFRISLTKVTGDFGGDIVSLWIGIASPNGLSAINRESKEDEVFISIALLAKQWYLVVVVLFSSASSL